MDFFMSERCEGKFKAEKCQEHSGKKLFCCEMCNKEIISNLKLQKRILTNSTEKTFECEVCGKSFTQKINLVMHMCTHTMQKPLECDKNDSEDETKSESDIFEEMLVPVKKEAGLPFTCEVCGESYPGKVELLTHLCTDTSSEAFYYEENYEDVTGSENLFDDVLISSVKKEIYQCHYCEQEFTSEEEFLQHSQKPCCGEGKTKLKVSDSLFRHLRVRSTDKGYHSCKICKREFTSKSNLFRHMRTHTGEKPYDCSVCGKEFAQNGTLRRHMQIHTGQRPFRCDLCCKDFTQSCTLVRHMRTHTGEKPYKCHVCDKKFSQNGALLQHVRLHTGEKPYRCSVCQKQFTAHNYLINHIKMHTGEKLFECCICQKKFSKNYDLRRHMNTHR